MGCAEDSDSVIAPSEAELGMEDDLKFVGRELAGLKRRFEASWLAPESDLHAKSWQNFFGANC